MIIYCSKRPLFRKGRYSERLFQLTKVTTITRTKCASEETLTLPVVFCLFVCFGRGGDMTQTPHVAIEGARHRQTRQTESERQTETDKERGERERERERGEREREKGEGEKL